MDEIRWLYFGVELPWAIWRLTSKAKSWDCPCGGPTLVSGYNGNFCSPMMFILVNRAACGHTRFQCPLIRFSSGTLLSSGLRFMSNDHSLKHAYSLRPCSSSTARGPYMLGACEAPGRILGSLGSPRGYASDYIYYVANHYRRVPAALPVPYSGHFTFAMVTGGLLTQTGRRK